MAPRSGASPTMGFSSYTCAKTRIPFAAGPEANGGDATLNRVVVLVPGEEPFEGEYDGYGRVRGLGVRDLASGRLRSMLSSGAAKVVLARFHDPADRPEDLDKTRPDPGQGLHAPAFLRACHAANGFASHDGLLLACKGLASPSACSALGSKEARAVLGTRTALAEAVSEARMADLGNSGCSFAAAGRIYPHFLTLVPTEGSPGSWSPAPDTGNAALTGSTVDPALADACAGLSVRIGDRVPGRREIADLARSLVEALPVRRLHEVALERDGEAAGVAAALSCPMGSTWYEARVEDEPGRAWLRPSEMAEALGLDDADALRDALWGRAPEGAAFGLSTASSPSP